MRESEEDPVAAGYRARRGLQPVTRAEMLAILAQLGSSTDVHGYWRKRWDL